MPFDSIIAIISVLLLFKLYIKFNKIGKINLKFYFIEAISNSVKPNEFICIRYICQLSVIMHFFESSSTNKNLMPCKWKLLLYILKTEYF